MNMCNRIIVGAIRGMVCLAAFIVLANPATAKVIEENWEFTIVPYIWMAGVDGNVTLGNMTSDVDVNIEDLWDDYDIGGTLQLEMGKNVFGLFAQPTYFKITDTETLSATNGEIETEVWAVEFGAFYRLAESKGHRIMTFDFLVGGRFWDLSNEIRMNDPAGGIVSRRDRKELIDPMVGLRLEAYMTERLYFSIRGDVGGFNLGGSTSEVSWQIQGMFGLDVGETATLFIGYRDLNIDTDSGQNDVDLTFHGPLLGVGFTF